MKDDISIKYEPFKEIIIMEKTNFPNPEKLARFVSVIAGGKLAGLYWVDGIVFLYFPIPASNQIIAKELVEEKRLYWSFLGYSSMPKYAVIDISNDQVLQAVAKWLKKQEQT
ncbi:MAG: hypothetical protein AC479_02580 [miscellaneous Crenarchaeota group-6 archaeon AD8-1]|nr:MAG: hypothetical protein AC479_02580 [miscellaneous Crenarchaeota group-6 archaeon AD8-1]